ncbi:MAG: DNA methyltransferase [Candidatus Pacearchaeota archaeon]
METKKLIMEFEFEKSNGNGSTTYLTHNFHTYPAKFIPQIPKSTIKALTKEGDTVLDPFCGCGTTLVEAKLLNRNAIGVDLNPIATLVSKAKTHKINEEKINFIQNLLIEIKKDISNFYNKEKTNIVYEIPSFNNINHWFQSNVLNELGIIKAHINKINDENLRNYLYTAFSSIIVSVSNQESDTRFAAINKDIKPFRTFFEFSKKIEDMNNRMKEFIKKASDSDVKVFTADTQKMDFLIDNSVDHIVTSPPYANTYDYYLYHKFRMYWLGYDVKLVQDKEIGSRNRHSSKKEDISTFKEELSNCLNEMSRVLKKDKFAVIVIGDSVIRGKLIRANELMKEIASKNNFRFIKEISYNLKENSKMFNPKFTNGDKLEHVMFFQNVK